jgi:hypothetical protein
MIQKPFISDRYFVMHDCRASFGQFVLRSPKSYNYAYNIDIIFADTKFIQVFTRLQGVKIYRNDDALAKIPYPTVHKYLSNDNSYLFCLESNEEIYYIAAFSFRVFENQLEFNESSLHLNPGVEVASSLSKLI